MTTKGLSKINFTQISNDFIDLWMSKLTPKATLVFISISRKTIGWHKNTDFISVSQIMEYSGLSKNSVLAGIKDLEEYGLILKESNTIGNVSLPNTYTINFSEVQDMHEGCKPCTGGGAGHERGGGASREPTKETSLNKDKEILSTPKKNVIKNEELFDRFWEEYNLKKDKQLTIKTWNKLTIKQQEKAFENIKPYINSLNDLKYQKKPNNYLSHGTYEDDFEVKKKFQDYA